MANTPAWFIEDDYLASKLAQLIASGETEYETTEQVKEAIEAEGFTTFEHFEKFGGEEKTSPNAYFDVAYYLQAKADQLNNSEDEARDDWTADAVYDAIIAEGLTPWSHFQAWGWKEGVNPSADFDLEAYFADKLQQLIDAGEDYETVEQVKDAFEEAGIDPVAHYYAWGADEGLTPKSEREAQLEELTEAVEAYQDAVEARTEFLAEAAENELVAVELTTDDPSEQDIRDAISAARLTAKDGDGGDGGLDGTSPLELAYADADDAEIIADMIALDQKAAAKALAEAEEGVAGISGLKTAINAAIAANNRYNDAIDPSDEALKEATGETGRFDALNADTGESYEFVLDRDSFENENPEVVTFTDGDGTRSVITVGDNGLEVEEDFAGLAGIDVLLASAQAAYDALALEFSRKERLKEAIARVINVEADPETPVKPDDIDDLDDYRDNGGNLDFNNPTHDTDVTIAYFEAKNASDAFSEAVAAYNEVIALLDARDVHDARVDEAEEAIGELGFNLVEFDPETNEAVGTEDSDVFVYIGADEATIDLFGEMGDDVLFIGTEYEFNDDIENGDPAALEVFFTQQGDDLLVTIERVPFGTNVDGDPEVDTILLTGVSIDSVTFEQGYVQLVG